MHHTETQIKDEGRMKTEKETVRESSLEELWLS